MWMPYGDTVCVCEEITVYGAAGAAEEAIS